MEVEIIEFIRDYPTVLLMVYTALTFSYKLHRRVKGSPDRRKRRREIP